MSRAAIAQRCCSTFLTLDPRMHTLPRRSNSNTLTQCSHILNLKVEKKSLLNLNDGDYEKSQS